MLIPKFTYVLTTYLPEIQKEYFLLLFIPKYIKIQIENFPKSDIRKLRYLYRFYHDCFL